MKFQMYHENYNVKDLKKSLDFYREALGLTEQRRIEAPDGSFIIVYLGNDTTDFQLELTWLKDHPQDYQGAHDLHERMGCIVFENPEMGIYFITDPDGYWLEIVPEKR